jgi:WD40 repeat protein
LFLRCHHGDDHEEDVVASPIHCVAVVADGLLATGSDEAPVKVWDPTTGVERHRLGGFMGAIYCLAAVVATDSSCSGSDGSGGLLAGGSDSHIFLWCTATWSFLRKLSG